MGGMIGVDLVISRLQCTTCCSYQSSLKVPNIASSLSTIASGGTGGECRPYHKQQLFATSRRSLLQDLCVTITAPAALALLVSSPLPAAHASTTAPTFERFTSLPQGYSLQRPASWEQVEKPGADALFRDPQRKSTNVGVAVLPVMIASLGQFGDLQAAGEKLLGAERAKESTLAAEMVTQTQRATAMGPVYDFEYELESTRGRKRIVSSVTIASGKLYILNGTVSCDKQSCDGEDSQVALVRHIAQSFAVMAAN